MSFLALTSIIGTFTLFSFIAYEVPLFFICLECYSLVISQSFPIFNVGGRYINISPDYFIIPILIGAWLISVVKKSKIQRLPFFTVPYALFSGWALLTITVSVIKYGLSEHVIPFIETAKWFIYTLIFLPCMEFIRTEKQARTVLKHVVIAAIIVVIVGYIQWAVLPSRSQGNIVSTFGSIWRDDIITVKNSFAVYMAMGSIIAIAFFISRCIDVWEGVFIISTFIVLVFWAFSRSAMLGLLCALFWLFATKSRAHYISVYVSKRTAWLMAALLVFSMVLIGNYAISDRDFAEYTPIGSLASLWGDTVESQGARSVEARREMLKMGIPALLDKPIWGYGFFSRTVTRNDLTIVDNFFMDVALDTGFVGLLLMVWLLLSVLVFVFRIKQFALRRNAADLHAWAWGIGAALVCLYVSGVSASIPYVGRILGTVVIVLACIAMWAKSEKTASYG